MKKENKKSKVKSLVRSKPVERSMIERFLWVPFVMALVVLLVYAFFRGASNDMIQQQRLASQKAWMEAHKPTEMPEKLPTITTSEITAQVSMTFKRRQFDISKKFFIEEAYPKELTQISEDDLQEMMCTPDYEKLGDVFQDGQRKIDRQSDPKIMHFVDAIEKNYKDTKYPHVMNIQTCSSKSGEELLLYGMGPCGGGCGGIPFIAEYRNQQVKQLVEVEGKEAYFGCNPLQLTNGNDLYLNCGGGDGPTNSRYIYRLSLNDSSFTKLKYCTATVNDFQTQKVVSHCE